MLDQLGVEITNQANATLVALVGSVNLAGADVLDRKIMALTALHAKYVIFDLSRVAFISSLGMGALVRYRNACAHWGGRMVLAGANEEVATALKRARLDQVLNLRESVEMAIAES